MENLKKSAAWLLFPLLLLMLMATESHAADANRPGNKRYHNYVSYVQWKADSTLIATDDTLFLVSDSANSVPFTTATVGAMATTLTTEFARIPDSIGFLVKAFGDASDASSYEFNVQYSINGKNGPWYTLGTPDTITVANATPQVNFPLSRKFIPDAMFRATIITTTATDVTRLAEARAFPVFR